ncbi:DinB family protein [Chloroflexota bacterium]
MSVEEKQRLIESLTELHNSILAALEGIEMEMYVYEDSGWRVRDIIGHISTWDQEIANSLQAYKAGNEYLTPDLDEEEIEFNENEVLKQQKLSVQQILEEFETAYSNFYKAIEDIPDEFFPGDLLYPWGNESGDIRKLVGYMIEHGIEHRDEIIKASHQV